MSTVLNRETKRLHRSVNEPDFPLSDWIHDPDIGVVLDFPTKYWIITDDVVTLMDQAARDAVDVQEAADVVAADRAMHKLRIDEERILKAFALTVLDEINILRRKHSLADRTPAQLIDAIKSRVDAI